ncbi:hypothetical protein NKJ36_24745, partial [Mesorhizobium sp. M0142]|uniref:hypothetical protein n=1 Tax=Mesorhizobium sp. M0142 TaxID=2956894 RepID=UPI00333CAF49
LQRHHRAMAARPSEQAPFSLQNFLQNLQDTILSSAHTGSDDRLTPNKTSNPPQSEQPPQPRRRKLLLMTAQQVHKGRREEPGSVDQERGLVFCGS